MGRDQRRLAAIVSADVAGYSRLMGMDESGTLAALKSHLHSLIHPKISEHGGRVVKTTGDGLLLEFPSVVDAVRCTVEVQRGMAERNADVPANQRIEFRIGINVGDIIVDGDDIFGDGVNVAARLQALAEPGGICISKAVREQVSDKLRFAFEYLGPQKVKNIAKAVEAFRVEMGPHAPSGIIESRRSWKLLLHPRSWRWLAAAVFALAAIGGGVWGVARVNHTQQTPAMKLVLRADRYDANARESVREARLLYDEALQLQRDLMPALLGRGYTLISELELDPGPERDRLVADLMSTSDRAISVDRNDALAWELRAIALGWQTSLVAAFEADARARQMAPSSRRNARAWLLLMSGQPSQALEVVDLALAVDKQQIQNYQLIKCWSSLFLSRYEDAIAACEKARAWDERWFMIHALLTAAYAQAGNSTRAAAETAELLKIAPGYTIARYKNLWRSEERTYRELTESQVLAGLRKAGIPER